MIVIEKWSGLITNASPYALPGGAFAVQTNVQCLRPGELRGRGGLAFAVAALGTGQVLSAVRLASGTVDQVVCQCGNAIVAINIS
jgi:hypothetical protein